MNIEFRSDLSNAFNRVVLCNPNMNVSSKASGAFGRVTGQCGDGPRAVQFALKFNF